LLFEKDASTEPPELQSFSIQPAANQKGHIFGNLDYLHLFTQEIEQYQNSIF